MKRLTILLSLVIAVAAVSYSVSYYRGMASVVAVTPDGTDAELAWLKREFALTPPQYEKILALHHAYQPICAGHCSSYIAVHRRLSEILNNGTSWSPEAGAAMAEQARIQAECHGSMLKYAYDVAECMSPEQGRRYLKMVKMRLLEGDPAGMFAHAH